MKRVRRILTDKKRIASLVSSALIRFIRLIRVLLASVLLETS